MRGDSANRSAGFRIRRGIVAIGPSKAGIAFSFAKGAASGDPFNLLRCAGKVCRNVLVRGMDDFHEDALAHYIRQTVEFDCR